METVDNLILKTVARSKYDKQLKFDVFYKKLISYKEKNGDFNGLTIDPEIGSLVTRIRAAYKGSNSFDLTPEMIDKLNEIGFPWRAGYAKWFESFFKKLVKYKEEHGSFYGVTKVKEIGFYVLYIRNGFLKIDQSMVDRLNDIGFTWKAEFGLWFEPFYEKLIEYKNKKGSFKGITTHPELGNTVHSVRAAYKGKGKLKLTEKMIEKLNAIGFTWECKTKTTEEAVDFKK